MSKPPPRILFLIQDVKKILPQSVQIGANLWSCRAVFTAGYYRYPPPHPHTPHLPTHILHISRRCCIPAFNLWLLTPSPVSALVCLCGYRPAPAIFHAKLIRVTSISLLRMRTVTGSNSILANSIGSVRISISSANACSSSARCS